MAPLRIVGIAGNLTRPSRTRMLVDLILAEARSRGLGETESYDLVDAGAELGAAWSREAAKGSVDRMLLAIEGADVLIAATPVYKASYTGLFKHAFDLLDPKALERRYVLLAATGGSERHALVVEHQLRPLFAFFGAHVLPISLYAADAEFSNSGEMSPAFRARIAAAVDQIAAIRVNSPPIARMTPLMQHVA